MARLIMSGDESRPVIVADGYVVARTVVEFAGPQPRSIILFGAVRGTCDRRSRAGWVRSFSNLRYWFAFQSFAWDIVVVKFLWTGVEIWIGVLAEWANNLVAVGFRREYIVLMI